MKMKIMVDMRLLSSFCEATYFSIFGHEPSKRVRSASQPKYMKIKKQRKSGKLYDLPSQKFQPKVILNPFLKWFNDFVKSFPVRQESSKTMNFHVF